MFVLDCVCNDVLEALHKNSNLPLEEKEKYFLGSKLRVCCNEH